MKKTILFVLAVLMLPVALAAPSVDFDLSPSENVQVNQAYTVTVTASDPDGVDSIRFVKGQSYEYVPCAGKLTCSANWTFVQSAAGEYTHKFYAKSVNDEIGNMKSVTVTVGSPDAAAEGAKTDRSVKTYSQEGAGDDNPGSLDIRLMGSPTEGNNFTLRTIATDDVGVDSIRYWNSGTNSYEYVPCAGMKRCSTDWTLTEDKAGSYTYKFLLKDTTGHGTIVEYDVRVGAVAQNTTQPPVGAPGPTGETATIVVNVADDKGPVQGANVNLVGPESYATTTGFDGKAAFNDVTPGCYDVTVEKEGQTFETANVCVQADDSEEVSVGAKVAGISPILGAEWMYILAAIIIIAVVGGSVYYYMNTEQTGVAEK